MKRKRELWVDNVKVIACILVVLGHFFQSMEQAGIIPSSHLYLWFNRTIYYFHVPLFFICSGYLYQKHSRVNEVRSWGKHVYKKMLSLGIPYFAFSMVTWILKTIFSDSTNSGGGEGLFESLFLHPIAPYWYLYALFFIFLIIPTVKSTKQSVVLLCVAFVFKILVSIYEKYCFYLVLVVLTYAIWFVFGIFLAQIGGFEKNVRNKCIGVSGGVLFILLSLWVYKMDITEWFPVFGLGILACFSVIVLCVNYTQQGKDKGLFLFLSKYTMPIFLMHTLFAAPLRVVLIKVGIRNVYIHILLGLTISIIGPIMAAWVMKKTKWLEFFIYPEKFIKIKERRSYENINDK